MTQKTIEKAARYVNTGAVVKLPGLGGGCRLWQVNADRGIYTVTTRGGKARCSCQAGTHGKFCSHALAALYAAGKLNRANTAKVKSAVAA